MAIIGKDTRPVVGIPHLYSCVIATGGDAGAIGRPGYGRNYISMPTIDEKELSSVCFPYLYSPVRATGGDAGSIGRPGDIEHRIQMTWIHRNGVINVDVMVIVMDSGCEMVIRFARKRERCNNPVQTAVNQQHCHQR